MLDLKRVLDGIDEVKQALASRAAAADIDRLSELDARRREIIGEVERLKAERNSSSKQIGQKMKQGEQVDELREHVRGLGEKIKQMDAELDGVQVEIENLLMGLPNLPHASCPVGPDEGSNRIERTWGEAREFDFEPRDHVEIGEISGVLDLERAAKVTGARFAVLTGLGARLERALTQLMLDLHVDRHGYREVLPPFIVNQDALRGTGQLPKFEEDLFRLQNPDNWYLVPTAEVPLTNLHAGEILREADLPIRYAAYTPCFRAEAGSHGRDVRGLIRQHQFDKVELVTFCPPEASYDVLEQLTSHAEAVLQRLGLHYRVVTLATGDLGFAAAKTYDLEVWIPSQGAFREISSCSNFEAYQARRAGIRYRPEAGGKPRYVHTLNGSGLAVGRTLVALLEQCQLENGTFDVPGALKPYLEGRLAP
jgi:seryl-tRNA synthetase